MQAIAILRIEAEIARAALGDDVTMTALEDAVIVPLNIPLASDPQRIGQRLGDVAGPLLKLHREPRGVPVYPSTYALRARTWASAIEELGEAADWVKPIEASPLTGLEAMMAQMAGGTMGGEAMEGLDLSALGAHLSSPDGAGLLESAMQMANQLAQSGQLEDFARAMSGGRDGLSQVADAMGFDPAMLQGLDLGTMAAQAQAMLDENPDLQRQLLSQLGAADDADDED